MGQRSGRTEISRYDFGRITPRQLLDQVNHLIRTGQMDLDESSALIGLMPASLDGAPLNGGPEAWDRPIDVFARLSDGIGFALADDDEAAARFYRSAVTALERFQGRPVSVDVTV